MSTAIKNMTGFSVSSAFFDKQTTFELFPLHSPPKNNRVAILYGKNGSGKSTIAQGFREYKNPNLPRTVVINPIVSTSDAQISQSLTSDKIFIFDEPYIESRIKIRDNGLDAIVLFGEQIVLEQKIEALSEEIERLKQFALQQEAECVQFTTNGDINSPLYWTAQIETILRKKDGWAEIGSKIKDQKKNLTVSSVEIEKIGQLQPLRTEEELRAEFRNKYEIYMRTTSQTSQLSENINMLTIVSDVEENMQTFWDRVAERPILTEREIELLELFDVKGISNAKFTLSDVSSIVCPTCLQPISDYYRVDILEKIENILDRGVDELQTGLRRLLISPINSTDYQSFNVLSAESYNSVLEQLRLLNEAINKHNLLVQQKIDNPFDIIPYDETIKLATICDAANNALAALESERVIYNNIIKERKSTETELLSLNQDIAHFEIESAYISLANQREKKQQADDLLESTKDQISEKEKEKLQLDSQRKNFQIAVDEINRSLEYIFFCTGRLSLELGTDQMYHLKTNGKSVRPSNISCGERNALALCYYFTEISKDMDARTPYAGEVFLVIDDPISSFDLENRIGILSFLRWKLGLVLEGCANTKVLIMSHDVSVMFDLQKALQEISKRCEQIGKNAEHRLFQLNNKILSNFSYKYHNEYTQLLLRIYEYATSTAIDADSDLIIGNVIRRVMEAFSTFLFKKGIDEICTDEIIMGLLPDNNIRAYYRYLMYRIVLNNESHFFENIRGTPEINFFCHISSAEKQRTAKDILCFMYQLNKTHLLSHLPEAKQNLDVWCANINTIAER